MSQHQLPKLANPKEVKVNSARARPYNPTHPMSTQPLLSAVPLPALPQCRLVRPFSPFPLHLASSTLGVTCPSPVPTGLGAWRGEQDASSLTSPAPPVSGVACFNSMEKAKQKGTLKPFGEDTQELPLHSFHTKPTSVLWCVAPTNS